MTFSIAGHCAESGMLGVAIATSSIAVGSRCPWVRADVGVVSTQNVTLPSIGPDILDQLAAGQNAQEALQNVITREINHDYRQVVVVDRNGLGAVFSGALTLGIFGESVGENCAAGGNLLVNSALPRIMVKTFVDNQNLHLAERLLVSLEAGLEKGGGEEGEIRSAALLVASSHAWPLVNLRVDWSQDGKPVNELRELWSNYQPQINDYILRALNPADAPSFGVPGDQ